MKRWRRPLLVITLLLLAGSVVNALVALACAAPGGGDRADWHEFVRQWGALYEAEREEDRRRREPTVGAIMESIGGSVTGRELGLRVSAVGREPGYLLTVDAGWPAPALRYTATYAAGSRQAGGPQWPDAGAGLFAASGGGIPTQPLAGFAINTLFYTAILALPVSVFPIRRRLRTRRGRCPKCGYDLAGLADAAAPCPECGAAR
jgi:hypothetical protein